MNSKWLLVALILGPLVGYMAGRYLDLESPFGMMLEAVGILITWCGLTAFRDIWNEKADKPITAKPWQLMLISFILVSLISTFAAFY